MKYSFKSVFRLCVAVTLLISCNSKQHKDYVEFRQYYVKGEQLYQRHCSNCHQTDGSGLRSLYPPLDSSDFMVNNFHQVICLIRNGKSGEMIVNGKSFNQTMPANQSLSDIEIAQIATYIYNTWSHEHGLIEVREASSILSSCE